MRLRIVKIILSQKKETKVGGLKLLNFKAYYQGTVIKPVCYWHKDLHNNQWNGKSRSKDVCLRSTDFQQGCQDYSMGGKIVFSTNYVGTSS